MINIRNYINRRIIPFFRFTTDSSFINSIPSLSLSGNTLSKESRNISTIQELTKPVYKLPYISYYIASICNDAVIKSFSGMHNNGKNRIVKVSKYKYWLCI